MKALFYIGLVVLILGIGSLFVPIPQTAREGISVGGVGIGIETKQEETLHPALSGVLILGGLGTMAAGMRKGS